MASDPVVRTSSALVERPAIAIALALAGVVVLLYSVLVAQELFLALRFFVIVFFAYLAWRFVRAFELVARAMNRYVDDNREE